jgi:hypothetical protein
VAGGGRRIECSRRMRYSAPRGRSARPMASSGERGGAMVADVVRSAAVADGEQTGEEWTGEEQTGGERTGEERI